jgi:hypothetical protein
MSMETNFEIPTTLKKSKNSIENYHSNQERTSIHSKHYSSSSVINKYPNQNAPNNWDSQRKSYGNIVYENHHKKQVKRHSKKDLFELAIQDGFKSEKVETKPSENYLPQLSPEKLILEKSLTERRVENTSPKSNQPLKKNDLKYFLEEVKKNREMIKGGNKTEKTGKIQVVNMSLSFVPQNRIEENLLKEKSDNSPQIPLK